MKTNILFTPKEANDTLPLVRGIVDDILRTGRRIRELSYQLGDNFDSDSRVQALMTELHELLGELDNIGCTYKDFNFTVGLVDFPGVIEDKEVLLCWRSDESRLEYFHDSATGYSGRRHIPKEYVTY